MALNTFFFSGLPAANTKQRFHGVWLHMKSTQVKHVSLKPISSDHMIWIDYVFNDAEHEAKFQLSLLI